MGAKQDLQFIQINNAYGTSNFVPYSAGVLQAYVSQYTDINEYYDFLPFIYRREPLPRLLDKMGAPRILCLSTYIWNWEISLRLASIAKSRGSLVIFGGPQVPPDSVALLSQYPYIDIAVHGEGEQTLLELLRSIQTGDFDTPIAGATRRRADGRIVKGPRRARFDNLDVIPSPYLNGLLTELVRAENGGAMALWETNRGCPYSCSYCDWGTNAKKVRLFNEDRLLAELEWFAENRIEFIFACDSNFGIKKRDLSLVQRMRELKQQHGFPRTFRACNAKNSTNLVFEIEKTLYDAKMSKGASLSMQSLSHEVLTNIRRQNIPLSTFFELQKKYMRHGMSTYTEIILALPGETFESFVDGIDRLLENGQHSQLNIYNCSIMVNAEMARADYQIRHGIRTVKIPILTAHAASRADAADDIVECEDIIVATNTMPIEDWKRTFFFAWAVQCFHYLGITQMLAIFLRGHCGLSYKKFYLELLEYCRTSAAQLNAEYRWVETLLAGVLEGRGFESFLPEFGDIAWPPEEASFLKFSKSHAELYAEISNFVERLRSRCDLAIEPELLAEVLRYQRARLVDRTLDPTGANELVLEHNLPDYIQGLMLEDHIALTKGPHRYRLVHEQDYRHDAERFAREVLWYGRKGGKFLYPVVRASD